MRFNTELERRAYLYGALTFIEGLRNGATLGEMVRRLPDLERWVGEGGDRPMVGPALWICPDGHRSDWRPTGGRGWCDNCLARRDMEAA